MNTRPEDWIGEAAARARVTTSTIRYYNRQGVLPPAERVNAGDLVVFVD